MVLFYTSVFLISDFTEESQILTSASSTLQYVVWVEVCEEKLTSLYVVMRLEKGGVS